MSGAERRDAALLPSWARPLEALLREAIRRAPVLAYATPTNFEGEVLRLEEAAERGAALQPAFVYKRAPDGLGELASGLAEVARRLPEGDPLASIYARRALQVCGDLTWAHGLASPAGWGPKTAARGAERFPRRDLFDDQADQVAASWAREGEGITECEPPGDVVTDDEGDPRSLVCRLRQEVGARRLAVRVIVVRGIAPLAAAGDGIVQVAAGRLVSVADVERTVAHEIEGHLAPACEAARNPLGIFALGTAYGSDDQEGRAVAVERRRGFLSDLRRRTLALRHFAASAAHDGATFPEVVAIVRARGAMTREAVRLAARAMRGNGLGRERIYIPALLRVEAAIAADPAIDRVLAAGRVAVDDAPTLAPWVISPGAETYSTST